MSDRAVALWHAVVPRHGRSAGRLALVEEALHALDRADQARAVIDRDGMTFTTKTTGTVHMHPLVRVERESRQLFARLWDGMCLGWSPGEDRRS